VRDVELTGGSLVGPYEVVAPIGAGGMGKVYRVRDTRLGREVALKVLSAARLDDDSVVRRFELEARLAGSLNHPNILAVYDVGEHQGLPYLVSELLEGSSLRQVLAQAKPLLPLPRVLSLALQTAQGLAAAHAKGIVHRDLKPDNLFVLHDGRVKILDFGIAKLTRLDQSGPTLSGDAPHTLTGAMIGTPAYMSPEQARGLPLDPRSDLFSFGSILYEMLAGRRAFSGHTAFETGYAILNSDPPPLGPEVPRLVQRLVFHCLEKRVELRFQSSRDLIFELEELAQSEATPLPGDPRRPSSPRLSAVQEAQARWTPGVAAPVEPLPALTPAAAQESLERGPFDGATTPTPARRFEAEAQQQGPGTQELPPRPAPRRWLFALALGLALGALATGAALSLRTPAPAPRARVQQLTFRPGYVASARYLPDGANVVFSAAWNNGPLELYTSRVGSPDLRPLGLGPAELLSVSKKGELAVLLRPVVSQVTFRGGTLAVVNALGGAPRELADDVSWADYSPDGERLAIVRKVGDESRVELPPGTVLYKSRGSVRFLRFSPQGDALSFIDSPERGTDRGNLLLLPLGGAPKVLRDGLKQRIISPIWSPGGDALYFSQAEPGAHRAVWAVTRAGALRAVHADTGDLWLHAFTGDGRLLASHTQVKQEAALVDEAGTHDLSWFDYSVLSALSPDGKAVLLTESGGAVASESAEGVGYLRPADGSPAVRLGPGWPQTFSADGKHLVMTEELAGSTSFTVVPTGSGESRTVDISPLRFQNAALLPGDAGALLTAHLPGQGPQMWLLPPGEKPRKLGPEGVWAGPLSPEGDRVAAIDPDGAISLYPLDGGAPRALPGTKGLARELFSWSAKGGLFFVKDRSPRLWRYDLASGQAALVKTLVPEEPSGLIDVLRILVSPDEQRVAWSYSTGSGALFEFEGLR
jgi:serine/threonine protein kinase/dipeptidyl aminopeptidase/acylaminoacyl peptidase